MSPITPDPYMILGVAKDAQIGEIRSAHRKLVLKCHPDKVQDPELKAQKQDEFQKVQQAYEILSDEKERKRYDDSVQLAELRRQMQNKANISVSRSSPKYQEFEIRTAEPSSYKSTSSHMPPNVKVYTASYSRSFEDERRSGSRYYDGAEPARSSRREATYSDRSSKREAEKERERERDRDKNKEERERRRRKEKEREREEELRRQEREDKKAREKEKKKSDKSRSKDLKRETENKRRENDTSPYIETYEEYDIPKPEKKKSSSGRKHDEKRERSSHRDDLPSMPRYSSEEPTKIDHARAYIQQSQRGGPERSHSYHLRSMPAVPTPPPADTATFAPPEEEIRRSSARPRSGEAPALSREKSYQRPSRERLDRDRDEPIIVSASPSSRHPFPPKMAHPEMSSSPPHISPVHRTNTMPSSTPSAARPIPMVGRSNTFSGGFEGGDSPANRGRHRSRKYAQVDEEDYEEDYERRPVEKERKHRSSKKHSTPERGTETRYHVDNGRAKLYHTSSSTYSRKLHAEPETLYYDYEQPGSGTSRVSDFHPTREAYGGANYRVKQSRSYGAGDIQYSSYPTGNAEVYAS